jgi:hypothetical protein
MYQASGHQPFIGDVRNPDARMVERWCGRSPAEHADRAGKVGGRAGLRLEETR